MKNFLILLLCVFLNACSPETETLPNGCLVDAASKQYALIADGLLKGSDWHRTLIVRYPNQNIQHAYAVWEQDGHIIYWDADSFSEGGARIRIDTKNPIFIAKQINLTITNAAFLTD